MKAGIRFKGGFVKAEVADFIVSRAFGLSFRKEINENEGMLFTFPVPGRPVFWNFGMFFPIDVIWLKDNEVVGIEENVPPMIRGIRIFAPKAKADSALEVPEGSVKRLRVSACDKIDIVISP